MRRTIIARIFLLTLLMPVVPTAPAEEPDAGDEPTTPTASAPAPDEAEPLVLSDADLKPLVLTNADLKPLVLTDQDLSGSSRAYFGDDAPAAYPPHNEGMIDAMNHGILDNELEFKQIRERVWSIEERIRNRQAQLENLREQAASLESELRDNSAVTQGEYAKMDDLRRLNQTAQMLQAEINQDRLMLDRSRREMESLRRTMMNRIERRDRMQ